MAITKVSAALVDLDGGVVINESSADADFRVESNDNANMFFVNGGGNNVAIGHNTPAGILDVRITHTETDVTLANNNEVLVLGNTGSGNGVYNAIKFGGNQQDMYIMSFNHNTAASRRLGFFLGSVAGDAVADERLSILGDGDIGMGTIAPVFTNGSGLEIERAGPATLRITDTGSGGKSFELYSDDATGYNINGLGSGMPMIFSTVGTERMRIDTSGNLLVGKTSTTFSVDGFRASNAGISVSRTSGTVFDVNRNGSDGNTLAFYKAGTNVGTISVSGSATAYNTSSDYRLKENVDYTWDATTRLKQLKPARFNFIADETNTLVDGFIAHEVSSIVPEAVTGEKDATEMQGIDQSKLVPLLVKTIQELEARITTLEG